MASSFADSIPHGRVSAPALVPHPQQRRVARVYEIDNPNVGLVGMLPVQAASVLLQSAFPRHRHRQYQVKQNFGLRAPPSIRFPSPKPRQNTSPRQLTSQKLVASTPKTGARQTRHTSQPKVRKKQLLTRRYADRTRTPIQAALTYPIEGHCPPAQKPLQPPTTVARVPAPASEKHPDVRPFAGS